MAHVLETPSRTNYTELYVLAVLLSQPHSSLWVSRELGEKSQENGYY